MYLPPSSDSSNANPWVQFFCSTENRSEGARASGRVFVVEEGERVLLALLPRHRIVYAA